MRVIYIVRTIVLWISLLSLHLLGVPRAFAQLVYTVRGSEIVSIDPATGAHASVAPLPGSGGVQLGSSFDSSGRRLFFRVPTATGTALVSLSVSTSVATQVPATDTFGFTEYDTAAGVVYTVRGSEVISINPVTGAIATVAPLPGSGGVQPGSSFDPSGRRLFFRVPTATGTALVSLSVSTGVAMQVPAEDTFGFTEYDRAAGVAYTVRGSEVISINPVTGAIATVAPLPGSGGVQPGSSFDPSGRRLLFRVPTATGTALVSLSVSTGVATQVPATDTFGFTEFGLSSASVDIPTFDTTTSVVLALVLLLLGVLRIQR